MKNIDLICERLKDSIEKRKVYRKELIEFLKVNINHTAVSPYAKGKINSKKAAMIHDGTLMDCASYLYHSLQREGDEQ